MISKIQKSLYVRRAGSGIRIPQGQPQNVKSQQDMVSGLQASANILYEKSILRQPLFYYPVFRT
ncbi:hypothetical protein DW886_02635 [Enterocloster aldenensis]|nr:hypothetical protein DW886_02635 [Enterocloster aldenensis]